MEDSDRNRITANLDVLEEKTQWNEALELELVKNGMFSSTMMEDVKKARRPVRCLYEKTRKRGPEAYHKLIRCLSDSGNLDPAQILRSNAAPGRVWNRPNYLPTTVDAKPLGLTSPVVGIARLADAPVEVRVVGSQFQRLGRDTYPLTKGTRGKCLIINNQNFDRNHGLDDRKGSEVDALNLQALFSQLHFDVSLKPDLAGLEIRQELISFSEDESHRHAEMAIVVILSHGTEDVIFGCDGRKVPTFWIKERFNSVRCPNLKGKPKLILLQACRGDEVDYGVQTQTDAKRVSVEPTWKDMIVANSTVPGQVANRNTRYGTWYVQSVCKVFMSRAADTELKSLLDLVSMEMETFESEYGTKQNCTYEVFGFNKKLYFNPGFPEFRCQEEEEKEPLVQKMALVSIGLVKETAL